jgi:hypothetical protein
VLGATTGGNKTSVTVAKVTGGAKGQNMVVPVEESDRIVLVDQRDDLQNGRGLGCGSKGNFQEREFRASAHVFGEVD